MGMHIQQGQGQLPLLGQGMQGLPQLVEGAEEHGETQGVLLDDRRAVKKLPYRKG